MESIIQTLSQEQIALLPTEEDVRFYEEHGWYISQKVIPDEIVDEANFRSEGKQIVKQPMTLKKGQMSFHHCWTIHGSYPNTSDRSRLAMAIHLQDEANHYRAFWNQQGEEFHICNELLCQKLPNGEPDFSDPAIFPVLWSEISR